MKDGPQPKFLQKRVAYYVAGEEKWNYADTLEAIPSKPEKFYLTTSSDAVNDAFHSGNLTRTKPDKASLAEYVYDPLKLHETPGMEDLQLEEVKDALTDQRLALEMRGNGLVYHSEPFGEATEITGCLKLVAWIALDVPDTDFAVSVFEIKKNGTSIALSEDRMRARYRESLRRAQLVKPGEVHRYEFKSFTFFSRRLEKGSRLRLVFYSPNSRDWEKNYNSGGEVADETAKDARTAHVRLYQDAEHASYLEVPMISTGGLR
jgi:putative CocE/NonD family hydrolase